MQTLCDKRSCVGCFACANVCPRGCISMKEDGEGFLRPVIDGDSCVLCGACSGVCPILSPVEAHVGPRAFAAMVKDEESRLASTSGGVFSLLAKHVIDRGGVVFGAKYGDGFDVCHDFAEKMEDVRAFFGAKYSQSYIGGAYSRVKGFLDEGRHVLFSGTPCQVAGLRSFLGGDHEKLLCVDLICHGVPSPAVWRAYVDYRREKDASSMPRRINLRSKSTLWQRYSVEFTYDGGTYSSLFTEDPYMQGYIRDLYTAESCFDCRFKGIDRAGDVTLGDFWGVEWSHPEMNDGKGTSLVLIHSEKALSIWESLSGKLILKEVDAAEAVEHNPMATRSASRAPGRDEFFRRYESEDFAALVAELIPKEKPPSLFRRIMDRIRGCRLAGIVRKILKK